MAPHNLPAELTSFIGRKRDLAELEELLPQVRLLTLTGPGGVGKSRLAIRLAYRQLDEYPDGVYLVQLASSSEPDLVPHVLAATLALREEPGRVLLDTIIARLNQGSYLLLLDNCEHLAGSVASLAQTLLHACPQLQILAASRESLNVPGEFLWQLEGLPDGDAPVLFRQRARHVRRDFDRLDGTAAIAEICRLLDGLPLAIELAAAQVRLMAPAEIRTHLDDRFRFLVAPGRVDPRHATLKAMLDWSYDLLTEGERTVFRRLSVFPGSFDLEAAAIASDADLLPILIRLVEKSMVVAALDTSGTARYHMLDTMRHYGRERLRETGEQEDMERRFIHNFSRSLDVVPAQLPIEEEKAWLARTERDYENLRSVLQLTRTHNPATMTRLAAALVWFWFLRGHWAEGLNWTEAVLATPSEPRPARARLLTGAVRIARYLNRYSDGRRYGEEALHLYGELGDDAGRAESLFELGWLAMPIQRFDEAEACFQDVLRIGREQKSPALMMRALWGLAQVRWRLGKSREARRFLLRCESVSRSDRDAWMRMALFDTLGHVLHDLREFKPARRYFQKGHDAAQELGDRYHVAHTLLNMAYVDLDLSDQAAVRASLETSLPVFAELGQRLDVSICLDGFALVAMEAQDYQRALRLFSAAAGIRQSIGARWSSAHHARLKDAVARCNKALPRLRAQQSSEKGGSMTIEQAVKDALAREAPVAVELSHRERTIAALIGEGMTSAQIAARLKIAERTVDSHAEHIRNKLGLHSRAQIAAWAVRELLAAHSA